MAKKKQDSKPGYGKLLEAWVAPEDAGEPIGCVATSFTFSPVFFEEECLARFLQLECELSEDGPAYLVEREEKLAQVACASALVDQHHCRGGRSLRWDLLAARMPSGLQHAKVSLLYWSNLVRLIISSANLTDDGYRRNLELFGVLDYRLNGEAPISCLLQTTQFLKDVASLSSTTTDSKPPALDRWNALLNRVEKNCSKWGISDEVMRRKGIRIQTVFSGPDHASIFDSLNSLWPGGSPPDVGCVLSPFFDRPNIENKPARELWKLLRKRGEAKVQFFVPGEDVVGEESLFLNAPESLVKAQPERSSVSSEVYRVNLPAGRGLHAKGIWLEDDRWRLYQIGSSNFTRAGTGIGKNPNFEANLAYIVDSNRDDKARKLLDATFPDGEFVDLDGDIKWKTEAEVNEDEVGEEVRLPLEFGEAVYDCDKNQKATIRLSFNGTLPPGWFLNTDGENATFFSQQQWESLGQPVTCLLDWKSERPPSGFWVRWKDSGGSAWWPVNVTSGHVLPPPDELKNLPLDVLINILSSARPLHRVLGEYLKQKQKEKAKNEFGPVVDPHKRVDTSQFILQRTRRISWALNALRKRLERPVVTMEFLRWRLRGPVGVLALAKALAQEATSDAEKSFLISELALELSRAKPEPMPNCLSVKKHKNEIQQVIGELKSLIPSDEFDGPENLKSYVETVFDKVAR